MVNLNVVEIQTDGGHNQPPVNNGAVSADGTAMVIFRDLETTIIEQISQAQVIVGCVAWLTSGPILAALAKVPVGVSLIVQKEDFLRPDLGRPGRWKQTLRGWYDGLKSGPDRYVHDGTVGMMSYCCDPSIPAVRCVGNHNRSKAPAFPRMHNKFLVFCDVRDVPDKDEFDFVREAVVPLSVWTGSFNLTRNATMSLENAVILRDPSIARAYYNEWSQIAALSEPLDWKSDWCEPEWRIGS